MEFMVRELTSTLKDLKPEMRDIKEQVSRVKDRPSNPTQPTSPSKTWEPPASLTPKPAGVEPAGWWHAVGKGKQLGASGVFPSWAEASNLVLGT
jgi:hypothetical protein